jgi:putative oxidoreductase
MKHIFDLIGRIFVSFIFLYEAYDSIFYFQETKEKMTYFGLTWQQDFLLVGAIITLILGGILVSIGYRSSLGALMLMLYWIPLTFIIHDFWNYDEPEKRIQAMLFMKNIAITGGLLIILVNGSGRYSIKRIFATTRVPGT